MADCGSKEFGDVVVRAQGVAKSFDGRTVLEDVSLSVRQGETVVIMGSSGAGKTTCLRILMGQERPDRGTVILFGRDLFRVGKAELEAVRQRLGVVFQSGALLNSLTVAENVALPLRELTNLEEAGIAATVERKLDEVGLSGFGHLMPAQISGGMRKRVGIARALVMNPELMYYDEPTAGLDPVMTAVMNQRIRDIAERRCVASVVVTHKIESAYEVADRMIMLHLGRVVVDGTPEEFRTSRDPLVRQFMDGKAEGPIGMGANNRR